MTTTIRTGYVHLRNRDYFAAIENFGEPAFIVARSLTVLAEKVARLRKQGFEVSTTAWQQIGCGQDAYTKPYYIAV